MRTEVSPDLSSYRVSIFFGPEPVEGKPSIQYCVFNVKKRSWKGGIQVAVEVRRDQLDEIASALRFSETMEQKLVSLSGDDRPFYFERAYEHFVQAICWCKLDLMLQSGITQNNQGVAADSLVPELHETALQRTDYITSFIINELDLPPDNTTPSAR